MTQLSSVSSNARSWVLELNPRAAKYKRILKEEAKEAGSGKLEVRGRLPRIGDLKISVSKED